MNTKKFGERRRQSIKTLQEFYGQLSPNPSGPSDFLEHLATQTFVIQKCNSVWQTQNFEGALAYALEFKSTKQATKESATLVYHMYLHIFIFASYVCICLYVLLKRTAFDCFCISS